MSRQRRTPAIIIVAASLGWVATVVAGLSAVALRRIDPAPILPNVFGMGDLGLVAYAAQGVAWATVGAVLMVKRPGNIIGLMCLVTGLASGVSALGPAIVFGAAARAGLADPLTRWGSWATGLASMLSALGILIAMVFPTGHGHTPAWDRIVRVLGVLFVVWMVVILTQPGPVHLIDDVENPLGFGLDLRPLLGDRSALVLVGSATVIALPVIALSVISRYGAAGTVERLQLRWFGWSVAVTLAGLAVAVVAGVVTNDPGDAPLVAYGLASGLVPVAIGVAILRYHLYEIDRVLSRTIGWALVTGLLVAVFAGGVLALQALLAGFTQGQTLAVAASTLVAFALFQPLRRRVQRAVDHRFDRARYDGEGTAAAFAERLRDEVDLETLATELEQTASLAVRPTAASLWLPVRSAR